MADMYQKMADCMKSEKTQQDCHKEAVKDCRVATASGSCPMMNGTEAIMQHEKSKHGVKKHEKEHDMDQSGETH